MAVACFEKMLKFTPLVVMVAPSGDGSPDNTRGATRRVRRFGSEAAGFTRSSPARAVPCLWLRRPLAGLCRDTPSR